MYIIYRCRSNFSQLKIFDLIECKCTSKCNRTTNSITKTFDRHIVWFMSKNQTQMLIRKNNNKYALCVENKKTIKHYEILMYEYQIISIDSSNRSIDNVVKVLLLIIKKWIACIKIDFRAFIWLQKTNLFIFVFFESYFRRITNCIANKLNHDEKKLTCLKTKHNKLKTNHVKILTIIEKIFERLQTCEWNNHKNKQYEKFNLSKSNNINDFILSLQFLNLSHNDLKKNVFSNEIWLLNVWNESNQYKFK